jgi:cobalt-zinc-cadmium efflux system protein
VPPHSHQHGPGDPDAAASSLKIAIAVSILIFLLEIAGGVYSGSLSLLSDAAHVFGDVFALLLALAAVLLARQLPTMTRTYGQHRAEVLAAFINGILLLVVGIGIIYEALMRLQEPPAIEVPVMFGVALAGLVANIVVALRLHGSSGIGAKSAFLHVAGDALSSIGVIVSAVVIGVTGWSLADPIVSFGIAVLVLISAARLLRETSAVLLQYAPSGLDLERVVAIMQSVEGVKDVHHLHIWNLTPEIVVLDAHVRTERSAMEDVDVMRTALHDRLRELGIVHATLEVERTGCASCVLDREIVEDP